MRSNVHILLCPSFAHLFLKCKIDDKSLFISLDNVLKDCSTVPKPCSEASTVTSAGHLVGLVSETFLQHPMQHVLCRSVRSQMPMALSKVLERVAMLPLLQVQVSYMVPVCHRFCCFKAAAIAS